ncbi:MAG TPA: DUF4347 domain-containing protein, partial [Ramlibacter sp.]|nr:DUF4347 domain-containing protein [Ramlibacter sp.]
MVFEALEPRLLLSADLIPIPDATHQDEPAYAAPLVQLQAGPRVDYRVTSANAGPRSIIVVDPAVRDWQQLLAQLPSDSSVVLLDQEQDGIAQIGQLLGTAGDVASLHVLGHGAEGHLEFGATSLDAANVDQFSDQLIAWAQGLTADADVLFYGCDVAAVDGGISLLTTIAALTGADVAASNDATGSQALGGDWDLEARFGEVETAALSFQYEWLMATILGDVNGSPTADRLTGTANVADTLQGKKANDVYLFSGNFGQDRVVEVANEGTDTIDMSTLTGNVTIKLASNGVLDEIAVGLNTIKGANGGNIANVEVVKAGKGLDNLLDLSAVAEAVTVTVQGPGLVVVTRSVGGAVL